jgi:hypothetical protein
MPGTGFNWSALPSRRVVIGSLVGALASGSLLGLVIGIVAPTSPDLGATSAVVTSQSPTAAANGTTPTTAPSSTSPSPSPSQTEAIKTVTMSAAAVPSDFVQHPENDRTMTLWTLQSVDHNDPNHVLLYLKRATLLTGGRARQFLQNQGQQPNDVAVAPNNNAQTQQFTLEGDAAIWGQFVIGDGQNQNLTQFALNDFLTAADNALNQGQHPAVWIKRSMGVEGPVIYLAEQYPA